MGGVLDTFFRNTPLFDVLVAVNIFYDTTSISYSFGTYIKVMPQYILEKIREKSEEVRM
jgi:hypothetical protein